MARWYRRDEPVVEDTGDSGFGAAALLSTVFNILVTVFVLWLVIYLAHRYAGLCLPFDLPYISAC